MKLLQTEGKKCHTRQHWRYEMSYRMQPAELFRLSFLSFSLEFLVIIYIFFCTKHSISHRMQNASLWYENVLKIMPTKYDNVLSGARCQFSFTLWYSLDSICSFLLHRFKYLQIGRFSCCTEATFLAMFIMTFATHQRRFSFICKWIISLFNEDSRFQLNARALLCVDKGRQEGIICEMWFNILYMANKEF